MKSLFLIIFCSLGPVVGHYGFFSGKIDWLSINSFIVFIQAFLFYGLMSASSKNLLRIAFFFVNIAIMLLLVYHRFYTVPLMFSSIFSQYNEGALYLWRALSVFLSLNILLIGLYLLVGLYLIQKLYVRTKHLWALRMIFAIPLFCMLIMSYFNFHNKFFDRKYFDTYVEIFGYPQGWAYELITASDMKSQIDKVVEMANETPLPLPQELEKIRPHKHVFVVQIESFQYAAFVQEKNGKKGMPFLQKISKEGSLYEIKPSTPHASANSDFGVIAGVNDIPNFNYVIYQSIPASDLFQKITPITWKYKKAGYSLGFYHGFLGSYYKRRPYIEAMNYDKIYFWEDIAKFKEKPQGEWGYDDMEMANLISNNQQEKPSEKSFTFFITVSSHDPFMIGEIQNYPYAHPQNITERYYNSFNYVDRALEILVKNAPEDSLFIMYSDHPSIQELPANIFFLVYSNQQKFSSFRSIEANESMQIIKSVLHHNLL